MSEQLKTTASMLKGLVDVLLDAGLSLDQIADAIGVEIDVFESPDATITLPAMNRLWQLAYDERGPTLGIDVGRKMTLRQMQQVGVFLSTADNVVDWMNTLNEVAPLVSDIATFSTSFTRAGLSIDIRHTRLLPLAHERLEYIALTGPTLLSQHLDRPLSLAAVELTRPKPGDTGPWDAAFGVKVKWDAEVTRVVVGYMDATRMLLTRNPQIRQTLKAIMYNSVQSRVAEQPIDAIKGEILRQLGYEESSLETVAKALAVSPRSLQRKLKAANTTFSGLQSQIRTDVAKQRLEKGMPVAQVATSVGYSDVATFHRAFKGWTGETPSQYARRR